MALIDEFELCEILLAQPDVIAGVSCNIGRMKLVYLLRFSQFPAREEKSQEKFRSLTTSTKKWDVLPISECQRIFNVG